MRIFGAIFAIAVAVTVAPALGLAQSTGGAERIGSSGAPVRTPQSGQGTQNVSPSSPFYVGPPAASSPYVGPRVNSNGVVVYPNSGRRQSK